CCGAEATMSESPKSDTLPDLFRLDGRVAVITGGAGMLGLRYAEAIAEAGGIPVLADLRPDAVEAGIAQLGGEAFGVPMDISKKDEVEALVGQVVERFG